VKTNAPIVIFSYLRLEKLINTINILKKNYLANESILIIFSDGPKDDVEKLLIYKIRSYLKTVNGFKDIIIFESDFNKGLAKSIIEGVSFVILKYGKIIVLEDDLITSTNFLSFMNQALDKYEDNNQVFSISGYLPNLNCNYSKNDAFFLNRSWSWGWATWANRWSNVDWNVDRYSRFLIDKNLKRKFSSLGSDVNTMLIHQMNGYIDSWYIRYLFHQFNINGITLYPSISKVINNGFDEYATHNKGSSLRFKTIIDNTNNTVFNFPSEIIVNNKLQKAFNKKNSYFFRIKMKVYNFFKL